jgi:hypothetical protein
MALVGVRKKQEHPCFTIGQNRISGHKNHLIGA